MNYYNSVKTYNLLLLTSNDGLTTDVSAVELHQEITTIKRRPSPEKYDPRKVLEYICKLK